MLIIGKSFRAVLLLCGLFMAGSLYAQATRTWISGVGDDANPCSRTAPCKTFAGAISKTATGGVIDILDPGGFGALTITKAITLENVGAIGGVLVSGTNGLVVAAGPNDVVALRGLSIEGLGTGLAGVKYNSGKQLIIERCDINNFNNAGIAVATSAAASLTVRDTTIHNSGSSTAKTTSGGIVVSPSGTASVNVTLDDVRLVQNNGFGLQVNGSTGATTVTLHDSVVSQNGGDGIDATGTTGAVDLLLDHVVISSHTTDGINAQGAAAQVQLSDSTITGNAQGILAGQSATVLSFGNNRIFGNTVNGKPTGTNALQ